MSIIVCIWILFNSNLPNNVWRKFLWNNNLSWLDIIIISEFTSFLINAIWGWLPLIIFQWTDEIFNFLFLWIRFLVFVFLFWGSFIAIIIIVIIFFTNSNDFNNSLCMNLDPRNEFVICVKSENHWEFIFAIANNKYFIKTFQSKYNTL